MMKKQLLQLIIVSFLLAKRNLQWFHERQEGKGISRGKAIFEQRILRTLLV